MAKLLRELDTWPFHDFVLRFEIPSTASWKIIPLTMRAERAWAVSVRTGGERYERNETMQIIQLTAGLRAKLAGRYLGTNAAVWGDEMVVEYKEQYEVY